MQILVINPYQENLLLALSEVVDQQIGTFLLIGNKDLILENLYQYRLDVKNFVIYDFNEKIDLLDFCKEIIKIQKIDYVIFGEVNDDFKKALLELNSLLDLGTIDVIDFPFLRHYLFTSSYSENHQPDYEEKKNSIIIAHDFMRNLDINVINAVMISNVIRKLDVLELNLVRMILKENGYFDTNLLKYMDINDLFSKGSGDNIYNAKVNLMILRNYDTQKLFIDTINQFSMAKTTCIKVVHQRENINLDVIELPLVNYIIDTSYLDDASSIVFAMTVLYKIISYSNYYQKPLIEDYV